MDEKITQSPAQRLMGGVAFFLALALGLWLYPIVVVGIVAMGAIIFVHELGHFSVCKLLGIRVEAFSIGFGNALVSFERGGTRYQIGAIPLGGYVKPAGEFVESSEQHVEHAPDDFLGKPWYSRALVLFAGPAFNFIFPVVFLFLIYASFGVPLYIAPPLITTVVPDSAAQAAGLKVGDQILKVDGAWTFDIKTLQDQIDAAARAHPDKGTDLNLLRGGQQVEIQAISRLNHDSGKYQIGVGVEPGPEPLQRRVEKVDVGTPAEQAGFKMGDEILSVGGKLLKQGTDFAAQFATADTDSQGRVRIELARLSKTVVLLVPKKQPVPGDLDAKLVGLLGLDLASTASLKGGSDQRFEKISVGEAAKYSFFENCFMVQEMVEGIADLVMGKIALKQSLGGPVAIVRMASQQAKAGIFVLLRYMMNISLILGLMNLLPIPILDGGTMMFCFIEGVRRKPLGFKVQNMLQNIFGAILILFMLYVTYNDIMNWIYAMANK